MSRQYVTTAIDYPNAAPHMGHVLEKVLADVVARWFRLRGDQVRFQIGTDEHGVKMQRTAEEEGISPLELADRNVPLFESLYETLNISHDYFIRTSDQKIHWPTVIELWERLAEVGALQKRSYTGLYCSGCERFMTERDLVDGLCPNHNTKPEEVTEENWFLPMSQYNTELKNLLTSDWDGESYRLIPEFREKETLALIDQGLEDVSFSRPTSSLSWGVPVPGDEEQTMYVWCDALTNYISGIELLTERAQPEWWDDANVTHIIGKDIARFHALIWPLMLKLGEVRTPDTLLIHGFLTSEGQKMSKSTGNVVVPAEVLDRFNGNPDPIRFYLSHEVPVGRDGDFAWDRFEKLYDSLLRNKLGNLLNRVLVMLSKTGGVIDIQSSDPGIVAKTIDGDSGTKDYKCWWWGDESRGYICEMNAFDLSKALEIVDWIIGEGNTRMDTDKPWTLDDQEKIAILSHLAELLRHISLMLLPFIPATAQEIARQLGVPYADAMLEKEFAITDELKAWGGQSDWKEVGEPEILFAPLSE